MTHDKELLPCPDIWIAHSGSMYGDSLITNDKEEAEHWKKLGMTVRGFYSTPPPPSGDAVRLAVEALEACVEECRAQNRSGLIARADLSVACDNALSALRALPATPVNPPSAERVEAYKFIEKEIVELIKDASGEELIQSGQFVHKAEWALNTIRAALSAPVDTGWIDEMRKAVADVTNKQMATPEYIAGIINGYNAALDAVKQKLYGRG